MAIEKVVMIPLALLLGVQSTAAFMSAPASIGRLHANPERPADRHEARSFASEVCRLPRASVALLAPRMDMSTTSSSNSVLSFLCPLLKLVANSDPTAPRSEVLETATTGFASMARLPWGR